jgi:hypothetical protein
MNLMKKIFSFIFAGVILFNTCGDFFIFKYRQFLAKHEMKEWIQTETSFSNSISLTIISPGENHDFTWLEAGEFIYKGKLYDVVSEKISGPVHYFTCLYDRSEESLINNFTHCQLLASQMGSQDKSRHQQVLIQLLIKQALVKTVTITYPSSTNCVMFPPLSSGTVSLHFPPLSPPPKVS